LNFCQRGYDSDQILRKRSSNVKWRIVALSRLCDTKNRER